MTPTRLLLGLLQPLLALLLLAGAPGVESLQARDGALIRVVEVATNLIGGHRERSTAPSSFDLKDEPTRIDGDPEPSALASEPFETALDRARLIRVGRGCYPTPPPSHRPCAAPPTGPPSSLA